MTVNCPSCNKQIEIPQATAAPTTAERKNENDKEKTTARNKLILLAIALFFWFGLLYEYAVKHEQAALYAALAWCLIFYILIFKRT